MELIKHNHPSTRKMQSGRYRSLEEGREELKNHYIYAHNFK